MKRIILPEPPNPDDMQYKSNPLLFNRACYNWMRQSKSSIEQASQINDTPMNSNFVLGSYALSTTLANTATTTAIANYVLSLTNAFISKGVISQAKINN